MTPSSNPPRRASEPGPDDLAFRASDPAAGDRATPELPMAIPREALRSKTGETFPPPAKERAVNAGAMYVPPTKIQKSFEQTQLVARVKVAPTVDPRHAVTQQALRRLPAEALAPKGDLDAE